VVPEPDAVDPVLLGRIALEAADRIAEPRGEHQVGPVRVVVPELPLQRCDRKAECGPLRLLGLLVHLLAKHLDPVHRGGHPFELPAVPRSEQSTQESVAPVVPLVQPNHEVAHHQENPGQDHRDESEPHEDPIAPGWVESHQEGPGPGQEGDHQRSEEDREDRGRHEPSPDQRGRDPRLQAGEEGAHGVSPTIRRSRAVPATRAASPR
jgi:hypothetical protein